MKKKHIRFAENLTFPNMFQPRWEELQKGFPLKGSWNTFFNNQQPIVLEVGCGKGEYTVYQAEHHPENNYIGIDVKGARMWRGCKTSQEKKLPNVAFIRTHVQLLDLYFESGEVSSLWITFPDPQPRLSRERRRLTAPRFLELYRYLMKPGGMIHFKTDNRPLFDYTLGVIQDGRHVLHYSTHDLYHTPDAPTIATSVQTFYEKIFLAEGTPICYLQFTLSP